jgi:hypothetical protein
MRKAVTRKAGLIAVIGMLLASVIAQPSWAHPAGPSGAVSAPSPRRSSVPTLDPRVEAFALRAEGIVVRRGGGLTVVRIRVPARLASAASATLYRATVAGRFPPRALRYVVYAGERPIGYGVPGSVGAVRAVTTDPAVLSATVTVRYGEGPATAPKIGTPGSSASSIGHGRSSTPGPYEVTRKTYDFGDQVLQLSGLKGKVEETADVHYPTGLPDGPYPLVLFLHGNHYACYKGKRAGYTWPCRPGWKPLPNFEGYDYIAERLASYGFVVVSVSGNGVNVLGNQVGDTGMRQRGELIEKHIDLWKTWAITGGAPFGTRFVGKVDLTRIGTMGHSRGGEGVVWNVIVDRERPTPYGIDAVLPLAPVDFDRTTVNDVPMAVMLPYCDGDVSDLEGMHFFDDARYLQPGDPTPKHTVTVYGANHNFFNTVWSPNGGYPGSFDDGSPRCPGRLTEAQQRKVGVAYIVGFFRRYLTDTMSLDDIWTGVATPPSIAPAKALVSYLAPDTPAKRLDLDRFTDVGSIATNQLGGVVRPRGMSTYGWCADTYENPCVPGRYGYGDVHLPGLPQGVLGWSNRSGVVRFGLPPGDRDVSGFDALQFRGAINPGHDANRGLKRQDLVVVLEDGAGNRARVDASDVGNAALAYPVGLRHYLGHTILNQVRFGLSRFSGVDLTDIRAVELRFTRTHAGVIDIADLAFSSGGT